MIEMSTASYACCVGESCAAPGPRKIVGVVRVDRTLTAEGLIWLVASAGQIIDDRLVQDIVAYAHERRMRLAAPSSVQAVSGGGLQAVVDGREVRLGTWSELLGDGMVGGSVTTQAKLLEAAGFRILYAMVDQVLAGGIVLGEPANGSRSHTGLSASC